MAFKLPSGKHVFDALLFRTSHNILWQINKMLKCDTGVVITGEVSDLKRIWVCQQQPSECAGWNTGV
jgi:hypothetical protein